MIPLAKEGAERRQALGCLRGTRSRANDAGPQAQNAAPCIPRRPLTQSARRGCPPLGAPPRRFIGDRPDSVRPLSVAQRGGALGAHVANSRAPLVVAEGRCRRTPPGGRGYEPARRTPHPVPTLARLRRRPRRTGRRHGVTDRNSVNERLRLSIKLCAATTCSARSPGISHQPHAQALCMRLRAAQVGFVAHSTFDRPAAESEMRKPRRV
jgi:hypothetical protein